jgi:hypothetical protein
MKRRDCAPSRLGGRRLAAEHPLAVGVEVEYDAVEQTKNLAALPILAGPIAILPESDRMNSSKRNHN